MDRQANMILENLLDALFTSINPQSTADYNLLQSCKSWNRERNHEDDVKSEVLAPFLIGVNKSHGMKFPFSNVPIHSNSILVEYKGHQVQVYVKGTNIDSISLVPLVDMICQNIVNFHVRLEFNRAENEVHFLPIRPENKTWLVQNELQLPNGDLFFVCRLNGSISYAVNQEITTWNLESSACESVILTTNSITALAELKDGSLIVGDVDGRIYVRNAWYKLNIRGGIIEIHVLDSVNCILKSRTEETYLYNIEGSCHVVKLFEKYAKVYVLKGGFIAVLNKETVNIIRICNDATLRYEHRTHGKVIAVVRSHLFIYRDQEIEIWNVQDHQIQRVQGFQILATRYVNGLIKSIKESKLVFLQPQTLIFPNTSGRNVFLTSRSGSKYQDFACAGFWYATSMILLCDGSLMYATNTSPSGIHVFTKEGKVVYSDTEITNKNRRIESLTELMDGSVAVKFENSICIIKPKKREENVSQYRQYMNDLACNLETENWYQARRLYEKSRKIFPDSYELIALFLQQLEQTPHKKMEKRIQLDRYDFYKKNFGVKLPVNSGRRCKNRLFIGEGYFSYTEALINKHSDTHELLSRAIWATELSGSQEEIQGRLDSLQQRGVTIIFGINGETIHDSFKGSRFERIHWNCPFGDPCDRESFRKVIPNFFLSCNRLQKANDRVHVTLMEGWNKRGGEERQWENPIVLGSASAGYCLIRKRNFGSERYPAYEHTMTGKNILYNAGGKEREYVFEKVYDLAYIKRDLDISDVLKNPQEKNYELKKIDIRIESVDLENLYFDCSTDEDSSDYYDSE